MKITEQPPIRAWETTPADHRPTLAPDGSPLGHHGRFATELSTEPRAQRGIDRQQPSRPPGPTQIVGASLLLAASSYASMFAVVFLAGFSLVGWVAAAMLGLIGTGLVVAEILSVRSRGRTGEGALVHLDE